MTGGSGKQNDAFTVAYIVRDASVARGVRQGIQQSAVSSNQKHSGGGRSGGRKSYGRVDLDRARELWRQLGDRGLRPGAAMLAVRRRRW